MKKVASVVYAALVWKSCICGMKHLWYRRLWYKGTELLWYNASVVLKKSNVWYSCLWY